MSGIRFLATLNSLPELPPDWPHSGHRQTGYLLDTRIPWMLDAARERLSLQRTRESGPPGLLTRKRSAHLSNHRTAHLTDTIPEPFKDQVGLKSRVHQDGCLSLKDEEEK
jgi:hypothetical protein